MVLRSKQAITFTWAPTKWKSGLVDGTVKCLQSKVKEAVIVEYKRDSIVSVFTAHGSKYSGGVALRDSFLINLWTTWKQHIFRCFPLNPLIFSSVAFHLLTHFFPFVFPLSSFFSIFPSFRSFSPFRPAILILAEPSVMRQYGPTPPITVPRGSARPTPPTLCPALTKHYPQNHKFTICQGRELVFLFSQRMSAEPVAQQHALRSSCVDVINNPATVLFCFGRNCCTKGSCTSQKQYFGNL